MITQKLEEKILYNARGDVCSRTTGAVYEPLPIIKSENTYTIIPLLTVAMPPILVTNNDQYKLSNGIYTRR